MTTQLRWERRTDKVGLPPKWSGALLVLVGSLLLLLMTFGGFYAGAVVGACVAGLSVPVFLKAQPRWAVRDGAVVCEQQLPWRNGLVWWTVMFGVISMGMLVDIADGDAALRPRIFVVLSIAATLALAGLSLRKHGRLSISPTHIEFAKQTIELRDATVDIIMNGQAPMIRVRQRKNPDGSPGPRVLIPPYSYGLDPNTLASSVAQLASWMVEGQEATPEVIAAMLALAAPDDIPVGSSVEIPISPDRRSETPPAGR